VAAEGAAAGGTGEAAGRIQEPSEGAAHAGRSRAGPPAAARAPVARSRRAATYVDRILKGAKPAEPPIEQPTKFASILNLRTAQALGPTIPPSVLPQATEIIQ
jgi:hypothetical protein